MFCPHCGTRLAADAHFCLNCGRNIDADRIMAGRTESPRTAAPRPAAFGAAHGGTPPERPQENPPSTPQNKPDASPVAAPATASVAPSVAPSAPRAAAPAASATPFISSVTWRAAGAGLGIGLLAALVVGLLIMLLADLLAPSQWSFHDLFDDIEFTDASLSKLFLATVLVAWGGSASQSVVSLQNSPVNPSNYLLSTRLSFNLLGLSGIALLFGAAFGVFLVARRRPERFTWGKTCAALAAGLLAGAVSLVLAAFAVCHIQTHSTIYGLLEVTVTFLTPRTFFMPGILVFLGALAGFALASQTTAAAKGNVFTAWSSWKSHARGWVRTLSEFFEITLAFLTLLVLTVMVALAGVSASGAQPSGASAGAVLCAEGFGTMLLAAFALLTFGNVQVTGAAVGGDLRHPYALTVQSFTSADDSLLGASMKSITWLPWLVFALFVLVLVYISLREAVRNQYDPAKAAWVEWWKAPLAALPVTFLWWVLFGGLSFGMGHRAVTTARIDPSVILLVPVCVALVEVLSRTLAVPVTGAFPGLYPVLRPGTVAVDTVAADVLPVDSQASTRANRPADAPADTLADTLADTKVAPTVVLTAADAKTPADPSAPSDSLASRASTTPADRAGGDSAPTRILPDAAPTEPLPAARSASSSSKSRGRKEQSDTPRGDKK